MWKRLAVIWAALKGDLRVLWFALRHPQSPAWLKLGVAGGVLYLLMPLDLIPDVIPVIGALDDLVILSLLLRFMLGRLPAEVRADAQRRAHDITQSTTSTAVDLHR